MSSIEWENLPEQITTAVQERTGPVVKAEPADTGLMPGLAAVLHTDDGTRWFLKAAPADSPAHALYARELTVNASMPTRVRAPAMRWSSSRNGWTAMLFDFVDGRNADLSPRSPDIPGVLSLTRALGAVAAWRALPPIAEHVAALQEKAAKMLGLLDGQQRDLYAAALDGFDVAALGGDRLVHYDLHPGNLKVTEAGDVMALDLSFACQGAPGVDVAFLIPRMITAGHTPAAAEARMSGMRSWHVLPDDTITGLAALWTLFREYKARYGPEPARPARTRAADAGRSWVEYRMG